MAPPQPVMNTKLLQGALASIDPKNSNNKFFVPFQYNPSQLSRTLSSQFYTKDPKAKVRFIGTPAQSISMTAKLEAVQAMADGRTSTHGVYAQLAALELLLYPSADQVRQYRQDALSAKLWAVPPRAARTLLVWGPDRALPVELKEMSVREELFDNRLNPIAAEVDLKMDLINMEHASSDDYQLLSIHLSNLEQMSRLWTTTSLSSEGFEGVGSWYG